MIIPKRHQSALLQQLHEDHFGIVRTKTIARNYFWFPGIDKSIEDMISACPTCQTVQHDPVKSPLMPWKCPSHPWSSTCRFCDVQKHELSRCRGQLFKVVRGSSDEINNCVSYG